jgi:uncharacterized protein
VIGAIGMLICWISAFVLLPVLVIRYAADPRLPTGEPFIGKLLASLLAFRHPALVCTVAGLLTAGAVWISYRYIAADPFEYDLKELRSEGKDARDARQWLKVSDDTFGRGISGITYVAADRMDQVPLIVDALRAVDQGVPEEKRTLGTIHWIRDLVPDQQEEKRKVLGEIRTLTQDDALQQLPAEDRQEIDSLTPPAEIPEITTASIPSELADKLRERDGQIGLLVGVRPANKMDEWDGRNLIRFAAAIRSIRLANGETVTSSGPSVIFADIVEAIEDDGPRVTGLAAVGLLVMVIFVVGWNLRAVAVLLATTLGSVALVAACALLELRVNFLDFVALPITLGLGVDYAVNIGHRHGDDSGDAVTTLRTSGSAVFVCSLTTIIGYGSLLVSHNLAIRSFGTASLIGEVCCLVTALVVVPAVLSLASRRHADAVAP